MAHSKLAVEKSTPLISGAIGAATNRVSASLYYGMSRNINSLDFQVSILDYVLTEDYISYTYYSIFIFGELHVLLENFSDKVFQLTAVSRLRQAIEDYPEHQDQYQGFLKQLWAEQHESSKGSDMDNYLTVLRLS